MRAWASTSSARARRTTSWRATTSAPTPPAPRPLPNAINGLDIVSGATSNTVGGTTAGARDVISGNTFNGVVLAFAGTEYNVVEGDYIGTDD